MKVNIKLLHADAIIPKYQTSGSAGFDIHAVEHTEVYPGETKVLKTGLSFEIPEGYELQIVPRSGISAKTKLRISNSPGTIDSDFRGEVGIIVDNIDFHSDKKIPYIIKIGDRIAQGKNPFASPTELRYPLPEGFNPKIFAPVVNSMPTNPAYREPLGDTTR